MSLFLSHKIYCCTLDLFRSWGAMKEILRTVFQLLPSVLSLMLLVVVFLFVFTIAGLRLFGNRYIQFSTCTWTMSITTLVVIFSAPMPKSPGGLVVRASEYSEVRWFNPWLYRTQIFSLFMYVYNFYKCGTTLTLM